MLLLCALGCDEGSSDSGGFETTTTPSTKGSGGFSSDLAKSMGSGSGTTVAVNDTPKGADAGSAKSTDAGSAKATDVGSAKATDAGSAKAADAGSAKAADAGSAKAADAGSAKAADAGSAKGTDAKGTDAKGSAAKVPDAKVPDAGSAKVPDAKGSAAKVPDAGSAKAPEVKVTAGSAAKPPEKGPPQVAARPIDTAKPRVYVKPPADLAAIKLSLLPNWDRDYGEAGTISLVVKVQGTDQTRVFAFRYGYEDPKAPADRDAYKKWLADNGILKAPAGGTLIDRQRGGSWYLEGVDGSGAPMFRNVVVYGGKKLICGGSLYRDAVSNQLNDIRDKTIIQAKEICGDLGL